MKNQQQHFQPQGVNELMATLQKNNLRELLGQWTIYHDIHKEVDDYISKKPLDIQETFMDAIRRSHINFSRAAQAVENNMKVIEEENKNLKEELYCALKENNLLRSNLERKRLMLNDIMRDSGLEVKEETYE